MAYLMLMYVKKLLTHSLDVSKLKSDTNAALYTLAVNHHTN